MMEKTLCFFHSFCLTCDLFSTTVAMEPDLGDSTLKRNPEETTKFCRVKKAHTAKEIYLKLKNGVARKLFQHFSLQLKSVKSSFPDNFRIAPIITFRIRSQNPVFQLKSGSVSCKFAIGRGLNFALLGTIALRQI